MNPGGSNVALIRRTWESRDTSRHTTLLMDELGGGITISSFKNNWSLVKEYLSTIYPFANSILPVGSSFSFTLVSSNSRVKLKPVVAQNSSVEGSYSRYIIMGIASIPVLSGMQKPVRLIYSKTAFSIFFSLYVSLSLYILTLRLWSVSPPLTTMVMLEISALP